MSKKLRKLVCFGLMAVLMAGAVMPMAAVAAVIPIMPVEEDVTNVAGGADEASVLEVIVPEADGAAEVVLALEALRANGLPDMLVASAFSTVISMPLDALENIPENTAAIRFAFTERSFEFMLLDEDGAEYLWRDSRNGVKIEMAYPLPMDISSHQVVLEQEGRSVVARSYYEDGKVYGKLNQSGKYIVAIKSLGAYADTAGKWMHTAAGYMTVRGILGDLKEWFSPNTIVTQAEFRDMLMKTLCIAPEVEGDENAAITRQEMFYAAYQTMEYVGMLPDVMTLQWVLFDDWDGNVAAEHVDAIQSLCKMNIISGTGNGMLSPNRNATRAEAVQFLYNILMYDKTR